MGFRAAGCLGRQLVAAQRGGVLFIASDNFSLCARRETGCAHWSYRAQTADGGAVKIGPIDDVPGVRYGAYFAT
jgi:hypothetical protein